MIVKIKDNFNKILKSLLTKGSFIQNFAFVFSGKSLILIIGFLLTPIIARIYAPESYGTYAVYNSLVLNLSILSSFNLSSALIVSKQDDFLPLLRLSFFLITTFSIVVLLILYFFKFQIFDLLNEEVLITNWYLVPIGIFLTSTCNLLGHWNVREKAFRLSSVVSVSETIGTKVSSVSIGMTGVITTGLIFGEIIGKTVLIFSEVLLILKKRIFFLIVWIKIKRDSSVISSYIDYPTILLPSLWLSQATNTFLIFSLAILFSGELVGSYSMANSLLMIPVILIANASQPVMMQKVVELRKREEQYKNAIEKFVFSLTVFLFIPLVSLVLLGPPIIKVFLGEDWELASELVAILSPLVLLNLLLIPLQGALIAIEKNKQVLIINIIRLLTVISGIFLAWQFDLDFIQTIYVLVVVIFFGYFFCVLYSLKVASIILSRRLILVFTAYIIGYLCMFGLTNIS